jgi:hypothetical protein
LQAVPCLSLRDFIEPVISDRIFNKRVSHDSRYASARTLQRRSLRRIFAGGVIVSPLLEANEIAGLILGVSPFLRHGLLLRLGQADSEPEASYKVIFSETTGMGDSKRVLPRSSTTRTKLDPPKSPLVLNSSLRTLACRFADSSVGRLRPSSSGYGLEPPTT